MSTYIPHTSDDIEKMLSFLGIGSVDELFEDIPENIRETGGMGIPSGLSEYEVLKEMELLACKNRTGFISFLGCGSYDHIIPSAIEGLISRGEFLTAYTPYQAEISQGILQGIFEFQSMICELTGLDVSNASLYDGHTAAAEAAVIALNSSSKKDTILYSATIHPHTIEVLRTFFSDLPVVLEEIPETEGETDRESMTRMLSPRVAGVILQSPNIYGIIEDFSGISEELVNNKSLFIVSSNPVSLGILKSPGDWGAHIGVGDLQPFGLSRCYGGPSVGFMSAGKKFLRKLPGRISGQTLDREGRRAWVLTLQAREQHIKRARATSNICSNQALAAVASSIYMSLVGKEGLCDVSRQCTSRAHYLQNEIEEKLAITPVFSKPFFNEFTLRLPCEAESVIKRMSLDDGILGGIDLGALRKREERNFLTVAVTEKRTSGEMTLYTEALGRAIRGCR